MQHPTRTRLRGATVLGALALAPAAHAQTAEIPLDPIRLEAQTATTEGTGDYASPVVELGGKGPVLQREVPQAVNVVTRERIEDRNMNALEDAAQQTPGFRVFRNDPGRSSIFARGFELDTYWIDGTYAPLSSLLGSQPDLAPFDHVEFLKGPSALFAGTGEPGGTANLVLKRPLPAFGASLEASYGSWNERRLEGDVSGPLLESGRVRGRLVGAAEAADSFKDVNESQVGVLYGALDLDLTPDTTLSLAAIHQRRDQVPDNALPTFADGTLLDVDRSTFIGADWNSFQNQGTDLIAALDHQLDGGGRAHASARWTDRSADGLYAYGAGPAAANGDVPITALALEGEQTSLALDAHFSQPFRLFGQEHNALIGADYRMSETTIRRGTAAVGTNNVFNPNPNLPIPAVPFNRGQTLTEPEELGLYGQLRIRPVRPLTLIAGARASWYDADVTDLDTGAVTNVSHHGEISPYAGATLDVLPWLTLFASYTQVFQPQEATDAAGAVLPPREARQFEGGIKTSFLDGRLLGSLSAFRLDDENRAIPDLGNPGAQIATGEIDVQGVEAELTGSPVEGLNLHLSYAFLDYAYGSGASALRQRIYYPEHEVGLWANYTIQTGAAEGLSLGAGLTYASSFRVESGPTTIEADAYITVDAQIGYLITDDVEATFTVTNVFDETYYERIGATSTFNFYGPPRAYMLNLKVAF